MAGGGGIDELHRFLRRLGVGPVGGLLIGGFLFAAFMGALTIPVLPAEQRPAEIRFYLVVLTLLGAGGAISVWMGVQSRSLDAPEERLASLTGTRGGVSVRLALHARVGADLVRELTSLSGRPSAERLTRAVRALLAVSNEWTAGSIDLLPRQPEDRLERLARRMISDATTRYAEDDPRGSPESDPVVVVVSVVVTSALTIEDPKGHDRAAFHALLRNLGALASDAQTVDIRVCGTLRSAGLAERDRAMRPLDVMAGAR